MKESDYYNNIKDLIINNELTRKIKTDSINKTDLETKYEIGKLLSEAGKHYGENIIKKFSIKLSSELNKKYNYTLLKNCRNFYKMLKKSPTLSDKIDWSHYVELIPIKNIDKLNYFINICETNNITVRKLRERIKTKEYERLPESTKNKLITKEPINIKESVPEPIFIKGNLLIDKEHILEKGLQKLILDDINNFLLQLGEGYSYIRNEYPIKLGTIYHYIDLLLYNINYNCFVVIELKVTPLNSRDIGQTIEYVNYIDKNLRRINQNMTIGIILTRKNNKYVIEYSTNENIISRTYEII